MTQRVCFLIVAAVVIFGIASPLLVQAEKAPVTQNDAMARELYLQGEKAYKSGDLENAVKSWMRVLEIKPDSPYTVKRLAKARAELYTRYKDFREKNADSKDVVTSFVVLEALLPLMPDTKELSDELSKLKGKLTEEQTKAIKAYKDALLCVEKREYAKANEFIVEALIGAGDAACISEAARLIDSLQAKPAPQMFLFTATWCGPCQRMLPIVREIEPLYKDKLEITYIDIDLRQDLAKQYNIDGVPTTIIFDGSGKVIYRKAAGLPKETLIAVFNRLGIK